MILKAYLKIYYGYLFTFGFKTRHGTGLQPISQSTTLAADSETIFYFHYN